MNSKLMLTGAVVVVVIIGGVFYLQKQQPVQTSTVAQNQEVMKKVDRVVQNDKMMDYRNLLGVVMKNGILLSLWPNNELASLEQDFILKNGTSVTQDGRITNAAGVTITLQNNEELTTDGRRMVVDTSNMVVLKSDEPIANGTNGEAAEKADSPSAMPDSTESVGTYLTYSPEVLAEARQSVSSGRKVVLFFHAPWCPYCQAADKDFTSKVGTDAFPKNVTLIKTDYDSQTALKQKYGVTYQHTFVQVDTSGGLITKWISGDTALLSTNVK